MYEGGEEDDGRVVGCGDVNWKGVLEGCGGEGVMRRENENAKQKQYPSSWGAGCRTPRRVANLGRGSTEVSLWEASTT
jgi:hypothetical protein